MLVDVCNGDWTVNDRQAKFINKGATANDFAFQQTQ